MQSTANQRERPGLFSGRMVLLCSAAVLFIGVPVATWLTLRAVEHDVARKPLVYSERASWQLLQVRWTTLDKAGFLNPAGEALRDTDFQLPPQQRGPAGFYSAFITAQQAGDASTSTTASEQRDRAFAQAPAAIALRFVNEQGGPLANFDVGAVEITFAQVIDGVLDDSLVLVYPQLVTDAHGRVYLPAYDAPLKISGAGERGGRAIDWPRQDMWMTWPGQVGSPPQIVVH